MLVNNNFKNFKDRNKKNLFDSNSFLNKNKFNKNFVYIKFYKYLNSIKKLTNIYCDKYTKLKRKINKNQKKKIIFKKKVIFIFKNYLEGGILKIFNWKIRIDQYNFKYIESFKDSSIYEFWNMEPNYLKNIYARINRKHPYTHIYNLAYRSILVYPYSIKVKPYTVILKNYFIKNFLFIFEWRDRRIKDSIKLKIIKKYNKLIKFKFVKFFKVNRIEFIKNLFINSKYLTKYYIIDRSRNVRNLLRLKIKYLYWKCENWLWRYRNNWSFAIQHKDISLKYQFYLLRIFKFHVLEKNKLYTLPLKVFTEKILKVLISRLLKNKKINQLKSFKKFFKKKYNKFKKYKSRDYYSKYKKLLNKSFFYKMYNIYYYWLIFLIKKLYIFLNKIIFNFYVKFFYIINNINNNFSFFFNFCKNYQLPNRYYNIEANFFIFYKKINQYLFYLNNYYCMYYYTKINTVNFFNNVICSNLDVIFFNNLQFVYTGKLYNIVKNNFKFLLDYVDNHYYSIYISFKKYIVHTNRFINFKLNKKIYLYPKKDINNFTDINLSNEVYINNLDFLNIDVEKLDLDNIKFRKMHFNHKILGFSTNINDMCFKNYESFRGDDKRLYYI